MAGAHWGFSHRFPHTRADRRGGPPIQLRRDAAPLRFIILTASSYTAPFLYIHAVAPLYLCLNLWRCACMVVCAMACARHMYYADLFDPAAVLEKWRLSATEPIAHPKASRRS